MPCACAFTYLPSLRIFTANTSSSNLPCCSVEYSCKLWHVSTSILEYMEHFRTYTDLRNQGVNKRRVDTFWLKPSSRFFCLHCVATGSPYKHMLQCKKEIISIPALCRVATRTVVYALPVATRRKQKRCEPGFTLLCFMHWYLALVLTSGYADTIRTHIQQLKVIVMFNFICTCTALCICVFRLLLAYNHSGWVCYTKSKQLF